MTWLGEEGMQNRVFYCFNGPSGSGCDRAFTSVRFTCARVSRYNSNWRLRFVLVCFLSCHWYYGIAWFTCNSMLATRAYSFVVQILVAFFLQQYLLQVHICFETIADCIPIYIHIYIYCAQQLQRGRPISTALFVEYTYMFTWVWFIYIYIYVGVYVYV